MLRYYQLSSSVFLCLSVLWSGIRSFSAFLFDAVQRDSSAVASNRFLTLPFLLQPNMRVVQGWIYVWGGAHFGIDYVNGDMDNPYSWETFDVIAAADGEACANCVDGPGNKVWIKHRAGNKVYYTYYGHLASIEPGIPYSRGASTVKVTRG
jgi:hypothetical protein